MKADTGSLAAPFTYFGGKRLAAKQVWSAFGNVKNYVEPFCGSAAMLLEAPQATRKETVNDLDGFIANFWRSVKQDPDAVAQWADYPVSELDLFARHGWLINRAERLKWSLEDPDYYDAKIAGWWVWGASASFGNSWCSGKGPWLSNGVSFIDTRGDKSVDRRGTGVMRLKPNFGNYIGGGVHRKVPDGKTKAEFLNEWMNALADRLRNVTVTCGDWTRLVTTTVTTYHGMTGVFLDPPYTKGRMQYAAGGCGTDLPMQVQAWCAENGGNKDLRIVLCGHAGEHDALLEHGWTIRKWKAKIGYASTQEAKANSKSETLWCSPACLPEVGVNECIFEGVGT